LEKEGEFYKLSDGALHLIPYLSRKQSMLPVVLIHIGDKNNAFLYKREKRPYKGYLSLPGGRVIMGEKIEDCVKRIIMDKHGFKVDLQKIHSVSIEHVYKNKEIIHSFLLVLVSAKTNDNINLVNIMKNKSKIIKSDYYLLTNNLTKKLEVELIKSRV
jgi:ADP-ribose pyrophosphatase YjhB (NUDIX family)